MTVLVIGGGISALALIEQIISDSENYLSESPLQIKLVLLEEADYLGGRIRKFEFAGRTFEKGAY